MERLAVERLVVECLAVECLAVERFAVERFAIERFAVERLAAAGSRAVFFFFALRATSDTDRGPVSASPADLAAFSSRLLFQTRLRPPAISSIVRPVVTEV